MSAAQAGADLVLRLAERGIEHHMDRAPEGGRVRLWLKPADAQRLADALAPQELPEAAREVLRRVGGLVKEEGLRCATTVQPLSSYRAAPVLADDDGPACDCHVCALALDALAALGAFS